MNRIGRGGIARDRCGSCLTAPSRENHAIVSFNPKKGSFLLMPGGGRGIIYLNDEEVATPVDLNAYDIIELGQIKLMFLPLCGEKFQWS